MPEKHRFERLLEMSVQRFDRRLEQMLDAAKVGNRPMFSVQLTRDEQLQRWNDPTVRALTEQELMAQGGPEAVLEYQNAMRELAARIAGNV